MRRSLYVLVTLISVTTIASAQSPSPFPPEVQSFGFRAATTVVGRTNPNDMIARLMSFDADHNGLVSRQELPERMQPVVLSADANLDGALETNEIRTLALRPTAAGGTVRGFPRQGGGYGFGDEVGSVSSRSHIEGALDDLRLADNAKGRALTVAMRFMDTVEADARTTLLKEMEGLLTPEQLSTFTTALDQQKSGPMRFIMRSKDGGLPFRMGSMIDMRMEQFALPEAKQREGLAAVERYRNKIRPGESEQAALVDELKGILTDAERDDFRAALARRPLVKAGGHAVNVVFDGNGAFGANIVPRGDVTIVRPAVLRTFEPAPLVVDER